MQYPFLLTRPYGRDRVRACKELGIDSFYSHAHTGVILYLRGMRKVAEFLLTRPYGRDP